MPKTTAHATAHAARQAAHARQSGYTHPGYPGCPVVAAEQEAADRIADAIRAATDDPGRHDEADLQRLAASILNGAWDRPAFPFEVYAASYGGTAAEVLRMMDAAGQAIDAPAHTDAEAHAAAVTLAHLDYLAGLAMQDWVDDDLEMVAAALCDMADHTPGVPDELARLLRLAAGYVSA